MPELKTAEQSLKHLEERAPEVLSAMVDFDGLVGKVLSLKKPHQERKANKKHPKKN